MDYRQLGRSDIKVSSLCLGTMTWGEQNTASEGMAQIARAKAYGVNFIDTAEMYPVPPRAETYSKTEQIIGEYFKQRGDRTDWVLASKIAGPGNRIGYIRDGQLKHNRAHIVAALDDSLKRLQTDWIDLYQLHWPERPTNYFGQLGYQHHDSDFTPLEETLEALDEQVKAGKIRHIGLSNETPWGTMKFLQLAEQRGWARSVSIPPPTTCSTAHLKWASQKLPCASNVAFWPTRPSHSACSAASTKTAHGLAMRALACLAALPAIPIRSRRRLAHVMSRWPANRALTRRRWRWPLSPRSRL